MIAVKTKLLMCLVLVVLAMPAHAEVSTAMMQFMVVAHKDMGARMSALADAGPNLTMGQWLAYGTGIMERWQSYTQQAWRIWQSNGRLYHDFLCWKVCAHFVMANAIMINNAHREYNNMDGNVTMRRLQARVMDQSYQVEMQRIEILRLQIQTDLGWYF